MGGILHYKNRSLLSPLNLWEYLLCCGGKTRRQCLFFLSVYIHHLNWESPLKKENSLKYFVAFVQSLENFHGTQEIRGFWGVCANNATLGQTFTCPDEQFALNNEARCLILYYN